MGSELEATMATRTMGRLVLLTAIVTMAAAAGVGAWLWQQGAAAVAESPPPARPPVAAGEAKPAAPSAAPPVLQVPGTLEAFEVTDVFAKVSGYVQSVSVDIGDRIKAGQTLAVIDVPELVKELAQVRAEEAARAAALKSAEAGIAAAQAKGVRSSIR